MCMAERRKMFYYKKGYAERNEVRMKFKGILCALAAVMITACSGCADKPSTTASGTKGASPAETGAAPSYQNGFETYTSSVPEAPEGKIIQTPSVRDYAHMWWQDGFRKGEKAMLFQTGYYGLKINTQKAAITNLGVIKKVITETEAMTENPDTVKSLPEAAMSYSINQGGRDYPFTYVQPVDNVGSRIIESGRYMQSIDVMSMRFQGMDSSVSGRVEFKVLPRHFSVHFSVHTVYDMPETGFSFKLNLPSEYEISERSADGRTLILRNKKGDGLAALLPERDEVSARTEGASFIFECAPVELEINNFTGFGVVLLPIAGQSLSEAEAYRTGIAGLDVKAVQISPREGREQEVTYDSERGLYVIDLARMSSDRLTDFQSARKRNAYDRLLFTIKNNGEQAVKVPVMFEKTGDFGVEGMAGMLRDAETLEPIGVQVQTVRNWHEYGDWMPASDVRRYLSGIWYHGYTMLEIPAGREVSYELTIAYSQWGETYAVSHSQLCLAGWGGNLQKWETSSLGASGELMCYDAEMAHDTGAFINDIHAFAALDNEGASSKYGWSSGAGGGNFLVYYDKSGKRVGLKQIRTWFKKQGPCINEVIYTAVTDDDAIQIEYKVNLSRTNDIGENMHTFSYTFLKDVAFSRFAYYSMGSDVYNTGLWHELAIGNRDGLCEFKIGDQVYNGVLTPDYPDKGEYFGGSEQRIEVDGEGLWVCMSKAEQVTPKYGFPCNRMINLLSFDSKINGKEYNKPAVNLRYTYFYEGYNEVYVHSMSAELGPSAEVGDTIQKGSVVTGIVQYANLPNFRQWYYGGNETIENLPEDMFDSWKLAHFISKGEELQVTALKGKITQTYPTVIQAEKGGEAAQITIKGGLGYVPITFTGLTSYSGYSLMKKTDDGWEKVDQSVHGNDYWQVWYDSEKGNYEWTYNVLHDGNPDSVYEYKLIKG